MKRCLVQFVFDVNVCAMLQKQMEKSEVSSLDGFLDGEASIPERGEEVRVKIL